MLKHDAKVAKKKGKKPQGYVPRPEHPLLQKAQLEAKKEMEAKQQQNQEGGAAEGEVATAAPASATTTESDAANTAATADKDN